MTDKKTAAADVEAIPQAYVLLPMQLWRQVALHISSRDLARGLNQVSKAFRHLGADAICLRLVDGELFPDKNYPGIAQTTSMPVRHAVRHALLCTCRMP